MKPEGKDNTTTDHGPRDQEEQQHGNRGWTQMDADRTKANHKRHERHEKGVAAKRHQRRENVYRLIEGDGKGCAFLGELAVKQAEACAPRAGWCEDSR